MWKRGFSPLEGQELTESALFDGKYKYDTTSIGHDRFAVLIRMATLVKQNRGTMIVVIPPRLTQKGRRLEVYRAYKRELEKASVEHDFLVFDVIEAGEFRMDEFYDAGHLNTKGAKSLSRRLSKWLVGKQSRSATVTNSKTQPGSLRVFPAYHALKHEGKDVNSPTKRT